VYKRQGHPFVETIRVSNHSKYGMVSPLHVSGWTSMPKLAEKMAVAVQAAQLGAKSYPDLKKKAASVASASNPGAGSGNGSAWPDWATPDEDGDLPSVDRHTKTFARVHWSGSKSFGPDNAYSRPWGEDDAKPVRGYSSFENVGRMFRYFEERGEPEGKDQVIIYTGKLAGVGPDNEDLSVPDMAKVFQTTWAKLKSAAGVAGSGSRYGLRINPRPQPCSGTTQVATTTGAHSRDAARPYTTIHRTRIA
jgi:hypothetical protein